MSTSTEVLHPNEMIDSHYRLHLGCYFSSVAAGNGIVVTESPIQDGIWNHIYIPNWKGEEHAVFNIRNKHVYLDGDYPDGVRGLAPFDREVWMTAPTDRSFDSEGSGINLKAHSLLPNGDRRLRQVISDCFDSAHAAAIANSLRYPGIVRREYYLAVDQTESAVGAVSIHKLDRWVAIHDVCIMPKFRGRGYGRALMASVERLLSNVDSCYLQCEDSWLVGFYEDCGYTTTHRRTGVLSR